MKNSYSIPNSHILFQNDRHKFISLCYFCIIRTTQNIDCSDERLSLENKQILNNLTNKKMKNFELEKNELMPLNLSDLATIDGGFEIEYKGVKVKFDGAAFVDGCAGFIDGLLGR
jgi:hypothetical protein